MIWLLFKIFFKKKYIKIIFFIFKKLFLRSHDTKKKKLTSKDQVNLFRSRLDCGTFEHSLRKPWLLCSGSWAS